MGSRRESEYPPYNNKNRETCRYNFQHLPQRESIQTAYSQHELDTVNTFINNY